MCYLKSLQTWLIFVYIVVKIVLNYFFERIMCSKKCHDGCALNSYIDQDIKKFCLTF